VQLYLDGDPLKQSSWAFSCLNCRRSYISLY